MAWVMLQGGALPAASPGLAGGLLHGVTGRLEEQTQRRIVSARARSWSCIIACWPLVAAAAAITAAAAAITAAAAAITAAAAAAAAAQPGL